MAARSMRAPTRTRRSRRRSTIEGTNTDGGLCPGGSCLGPGCDWRAHGPGDTTVPSSLGPLAGIWRWSSNQRYSATSAYGAMFLGSSAPFGAGMIWNSRAPPKVRYFFWLVLHGKCWTANRLMRHGLQDDDTCVLCLQCSETLNHIVLGCVVSRQVWFWPKLMFSLGGRLRDDGYPGLAGKVSILWSC